MGNDFVERRATDIDKELKKNKWRWEWLEMEVDGILLNTHIRKLTEPGVAWCILCQQSLKYKSSGKKALKEHCERPKHREKVKLQRENYTVTATTTSGQIYGSHPMFKNMKPTEKAKAPQPIVMVDQRRRNMEAMVLGFVAENSLSYSVVPKMMELAKELARDPKALDGLTMDRTCASYKLRYGVGKTISNSVIHSMQTNFFSLNIDESTSNNLKRVLAILVSFYCPNMKKVVIHHLTAISVIKVDAESLYNAVVKYFTQHNIPWSKLISIMMDSCAVMRGSRSGFEVRIRNSVAPHLLDVDGDSCHHVHNATKHFCKVFDNHLEGLCNDIFNDFKWSADLREFLQETCLMLGIKYTMPERYVPHRWLSIYDVAQDLIRMWDAHAVFYFAFLPALDGRHYFPRIMEIYTRYGISELSKARLQAIKEILQRKNMTKDGEARKARIFAKIFFKRKTTRLVMNFYVSVLPLFKAYVILFQKKEPYIHKLHDEQLRLVTDFLGCFIKPECIPSSRKKLVKMDVTDKSKQLHDDQLFIGRAASKILTASKTWETEVREFKTNVRAAFETGASTLLNKMPINNPLLRALSAIDPAARQHSATLRELLNLPNLVTNVLTESEQQAYNLEVRQYTNDAFLPAQLEENNRIDDWWTMICETQRYPNVCKLVFALVSCFHGPAVESSFNLMGDIIDKKSPNLGMDSYCAFQGIKYQLLATKKTAVQYFRKENFMKDSIDPKLYHNMLTSRKSSEEAKAAKRECIEQKKKELQAVKVKEVSKRKVKELAAEVSKKARSSHRALLKSSEKSKRKVQVKRKMTSLSKSAQKTSKKPTLSARKKKTDATRAKALEEYKQLRLKKKAASGSFDFAAAVFKPNA